MVHRVVLDKISLFLLKQSLAQESQPSEINGVLDPVGELETDDPDWESHRVTHVIAPWGQMLSIVFLGTQWKMLHQIANLADTDVIDIIEQVVSDMITNRGEA